MREIYFFYCYYPNFSTERRLDEERVQMEAKKKEREEQHLFLTAKVCVVDRPRNYAENIT